MSHKTVLLCSTWPLIEGTLVAISNKINFGVLCVDFETILKFGFQMIILVVMAMNKFKRVTLMFQFFHYSVQHSSIVICFTGGAGSEPPSSASLGPPPRVCEGAGVEGEARHKADQDYAPQRLQVSALSLLPSKTTGARILYINKYAAS